MHEEPTVQTCCRGCGAVVAVVCLRPQTSNSSNLRRELQWSRNGNVTIMLQCMMYKYMRLDDGTRTCTLLTLFFSPPAKKCREV